MENTLDSIRPSENPQEEMSYLFGRDPSILAYSQRPFPSKDTKKNLLSLYEEEESNTVSENISSHSESQSLKTIKVYLRLKPFPKKVKLAPEQQDAYKIINSTTLVTKLPVLDNNMSCIKQTKYNDIVCRKFIFSQTFGPETTQLELFEQTVQQQMIEFLAGHNCTVMTYGTTNSGKSYTLQGTITSPGLIPRALEFVFSNITTKPNPSYKPLHYCNVISLNPLERAQELEAKTKLLTFSSVDKHQYMNAYKQMQKLLQEESVRPSECHDAHYSIWVSFAEIYNEIVYDLLSNECQKKRTPLKLGTDSHGRAFIKGLKVVYVNSAAEAYQVLMAGQYNLKVAATALNAKSSRSHCVFTITLLKYYAENVPETVEVSVFTFCDLAGSERLKKTLNIGDRLKEAQNINTSLLVLGRCLKSIHEGQLTRSKVDTIGPFRESKLTRLFQRALSGKEYLALIVNINPLPNLYIETQNVLNFAAIAKKIVIAEKKKIQKKLKSRFSQIVSRSIETDTNWDTIEVESVDWQHTDTVENGSEYATSEEYIDLANENKRLKNEIARLKNSDIIRDFQSRQEMAEKYIAIINDLEIDWKQRITDVEAQYEDALEWTVKQTEQFYEGKLNQFKKKRRRTDYSDDSEEDNDNNNLTLMEMDKENVQLRAKNESLKKALTEFKVVNETLTVEKNKVSFELGLSKEDLKVAKNLLEAAQKDICFDGNGKIFVNEMTSQLSAKDEQIKNLKEILNEAKEEYITIISDLKQKDLCIDDQAKVIVVNEEKIDDLASHLEQVNICLTEKTGIVELLEEKLECQIEKLLDYKNKVKELKEEINQLKNEKSVIVPKTFTVESHENTATDICVFSQESEILIQNKHQKNIIEEKLVTDNISLLNNTEEIKDKKEEGIEKKLNIFSQVEISVNKIETETDLDSVNQVLIKENPEPLQVVQSSTAGFNTDNINKECDTLLQAVTETVCQENIKDHKDCNNIKNDIKENLCYKGIQTVTTLTTAKNVETDCNKMFLKEEAVQTDEIPNNNIKLQLEELSTQHNDIQMQYKQECLRVTELTKELCDIKKAAQSLENENNTNKIIIEEYEHSTELLRKQMSFVTEEKQKIQETLLNTNMLSGEKITKYEQEINELEKNLSTEKNNAQEYLEKLEMAQKELNSYILKSKQKETNVRKSNENVSIKEENNTSNVNVKQLDKPVESISQYTTITKLNSDQSNENMITCNMEKDHMQKILHEKNEIISELTNNLQEITLMEHEKDAEIMSLQKEMKRMIQNNGNTGKTDDIMETQLKSAISELTQTKEILSQKEQYIKELKIHLENFERNAKIFNLLEENAKERQVENERLRNVNDDLRTNLTQREREMDAFMKNRDETVTKYEALVKNQQEELDRQKREVMRYQELFRRQTTPTMNKDDHKKLQNRIEVLQDRLQKYEGSAKTKDYDDTTSEDENFAQRHLKRRGKKAILSTKQEDIPVIELSGSESKRSTRRAVLPPPPMELSTEKKRTIRKKKLFVANDSFADIEPSENVIPATPLPTRSLRSRKK